MTAASTTVRALRGWTARRWISAAVGACAVAVVTGVPTDVIPNPLFGRPVPVTWWSVPTLVLTSVLAGMLIATYVRSDAAPPQTATGSLGEPVQQPLDRPGRFGGLGGLLSYFAIGCPVCNKLVVVALGTTGAMNRFAPLQPLLAGASVVLLAAALGARLQSSEQCPMPIAR